MDEPSVFLSYAHADKAVAHAFAAGLSDLGLRVWVDDNELLAGDSIIEQISTAVAGVDFFCALVSAASRESRWCQKELSLAITGDLGREGATVLPLRVGDVAMPESLADVLYVDVDPADVDPAVQRIARDVRRHRERRTAQGATAVTGAEQRSERGRTDTAGRRSARTEAEPSAAATADGPIRILGVVEEGVTSPRNDGTAGSALYSVPLRLSRRPSSIWAQHFVATWDRPPRWTTMHRPGIASVVGDTVVLNGTTMDEIERVHTETLRHVLDKVNADVATHEEQQAQQRDAEHAAEKRHRDEVASRAQRLKFD